MNSSLDIIALLWTTISIIATLLSYGEWKEAKDDSLVAKDLPENAAGKIVARNNRSRAFKLTVTQAVFSAIGITALLVTPDNEWRIAGTRVVFIFAQLILLSLIFEQRWTRSKLNVVNLAEVERLVGVEEVRVEGERVEGDRREAKGYAEAGEDSVEVNRVEGNRREALGYVAGENREEGDRLEGNRREAMGYAAAEKGSTNEIKKLLIETHKDRKSDRPEERIDREKGLLHREKNMKEEYDRGYNQGGSDEKDKGDLNA